MSPFSKTEVLKKANLFYITKGKKRYQYEKTMAFVGIGGEVFFSCDRLTDIEFKGTMAELKAVDKSNSWCVFTPISEVH